MSERRSDSGHEEERVAPFPHSSPCTFLRTCESVLLCVSSGLDWASVCMPRARSTLHASASNRSHSREHERGCSLAKLHAARLRVGDAGALSVEAACVGDKRLQPILLSWFNSARSTAALLGITPRVESNEARRSSGGGRGEEQWPPSFLPSSPPLASLAGHWPNPPRRTHGQSTFVGWDRMELSR